MTRTQTKSDSKTKEQKIPELLSGLIADNTVYYQKTRHYHWNLVGEEFFELHEVFEKEYTVTAEVIDLLAERVRALGDIPVHTLDAVLHATHLEEDDEVPPQKEMVRRAVTDLEAMNEAMHQVHKVTDEAEDLGTTNMLEDLIQDTEKRIWMLHAFLGESPRRPY